MQKVMTREPAMVFQSLRLLTQSIVPGGFIEIARDYSKRAGCFPPRGDGDFYFRIYEIDPAGGYQYFLLLETGLHSLERPGVELHTVDKIRIPKLGQGKWALQYRARFECEGERDPQFINSELVPFEIPDT